MNLLLLIFIDLKKNMRRVYVPLSALLLIFTVLFSFVGNASAYDGSGPSTNISINTYSQIRDNEATAFIISVDGTQVGYSNSKDELNSILEKIQEPYINSSTKSAGFVQNVEITRGKPSHELLSNSDDIYNYLIRNVEEEITYTVVAGDTLWRIAINHDMTLEEILELNPMQNPDKLSIGTVLTFKNAVPYLAVKTVEESVYDEILEPEVIYIDNADMFEGDYSVISSGDPGLANVCADITYINGKESSREITSSVTLTAAGTSTISRGTKKRPSTASTGSYIWPVRGTLSSYFGSRPELNDYHYGLDIAVPYGTTVKAADGGLVTFSGWNGSLGNLIIITHDNGTKTYYAHNSSLYVSKGERVYQGQAIAGVGATGYATGNHCHFEIRINGAAQNPLNFLSY